jgi:predicted RNA-binding Zn-ribbon protein involved in translation (DUF1610 family)
MRIPAREAHFIGRDQCPEFNCPQEPLPESFEILLCLMDGADRRRHLQAKLNLVTPRLATLSMQLVQCPSCGSTHVRRCIRLDEFGQEWRDTSCETCGHQVDVEGK